MYMYILYEPQYYAKVVFEKRTEQSFIVAYKTGTANEESQRSIAIFNWNFIIISSACLVEFIEQVFLAVIQLNFRRDDDVIIRDGAQRAVAEDVTRISLVQYLCMSRKINFPAINSRTNLIFKFTYNL